jgi:hypothetical protein
MRTRFFLGLPLLVWFAACSSGADKAGGASSTTSTGGQTESTASSSTGGGGTATVGQSTGATGGDADASAAASGGSNGTVGDSSTTGNSGTTAGSSGGTRPDDGGGEATSTGTGLVYPPAAGQGDIAAGLAQLNLYRTAVGENAVTLDAASSTPCAGHLAYLIEEAQKLGQPGYLEHTESDHANSNYSAANEAAGKESDLAWGQSFDRNGTQYQSFGQAIDLWINGLYHRTPLLDPGLVKVGAASTMGYNCIDYAAAGNRTTLKLAAPTLWPADGMTDVPLTFGGNEGPCPTATDPLNATTCPSAGFIPSANFYAWTTRNQTAIQAVASATLTDQSVDPPAEVPLFAWYADKVPQHDPAAGYVRDEIALVPQMSLGANKTYRVAISATVLGAPTDVSWTFQTGTRNE